LTVFRENFGDADDSLLRRQVGEIPEFSDRGGPGLHHWIAEMHVAGG
jgi:hypothetical protein